MNVVSDGKQLLRLATAGSVDDGKSTLIGRMLYDAKLLFDDTIDALHRNGSNGVAGPRGAHRRPAGRARAGHHDRRRLPLLHDARRSFIIADTPGHQRYTRNMVTGASTAQLAVILIDARHGIVEQSRRHATLSSLLGIRHLVAAVNKMDLVDWSEERFREIESDFAALAGRLGVEDARAFPISALHGDNVVDKGEAEWYGGPPLLEHLETIDVAADRGAGPFRMPVQWVIRPEESARRERRYAGQVAGGTLAAGDEVVVMPSGARSTVLAVETFDGPLEKAIPPDSVTLQLADDLDVGRGEMICGAEDPPTAGRHLEATVCWMSEQPLRAGEHVALKHTTRTVRAAVESIDWLLDVETLQESKPPDQLELNDIARRHAPHERPGRRRPLRRQPHDGRVHPRRRGLQRHRRRGHGPRGPRDPAEGAAALAGRHLARDGAAPRPALVVAAHARRDGVAHRPARLGQVERRRRAGALARRVRPRRVLPRRRQPAPRHLGRPGFSPADRTENIRRVAHLARLMADSGMVAIASLVSPTRHDRALARELHQAARAEVPRGLRQHAARGVRGARPEGPLRPGPRGQAARTSPASRRRTRRRSTPTC